MTTLSSLSPICIYKGRCQPIQAKSIEKETQAIDLQNITLQSKKILPTPFATHAFTASLKPLGKIQEISNLWKIAQRNSKDLEIIQTFYQKAQSDLESLREELDSLTIDSSDDQLCRCYSKILKCSKEFKVTSEGFEKGENPFFVLQDAFWQYLQQTKSDLDVWLKSISKETLDCYGLTLNKENFLIAQVPPSTQTIL